LNATASDFTRNFGNISFGGRLNADGSYTLMGNGSLQLGGYSTDGLDLKLDSSTSQISPMWTPTLHFGSLDMPLQNFRLSSNGLNVGMSKELSSITVSHLSDHLNTTFSSTVSLTYSFSSGGLSGQIDGNWHWAVVNFNTGPLPSSGDFGIHGGIGDTGSFNVDNGTADGSSFFAPNWGSFPLSWFWGSLGSESYDLW
jgi:hypothetical protein